MLLILPLVAGAALAPYVFNALQAWGDATGMLPKLTEARFEKVASRCVMILAVIMLYPAMRMTGLLPEVGRALTRDAIRMRDLKAGLLAGTCSILLIYLAGYGLDAYTISAKVTGLSPLAIRVLVALLASVFIGCFEEIFFRGFIFGALRSRLGLIAALLLSSLFFSGIHFFRPLYPETIEHASWNTGFAIMPYMFEKFVWPRDLYFALTLFMIGLTLALFYHKRGNLYLIIGLHAGWVFAQQVGSFVLDRKHEVYPAFFGHGDLAAKGMLAVIIISLFFLAALLDRSRRTD